MLRIHGRNGHTYGLCPMRKCFEKNMNLEIIPKLIQVYVAGFQLNSIYNSIYDSLFSVSKIKFRILYIHLYGMVEPALVQIKLRTSTS
jgi:hypothetical protein